MNNIIEKIKRVFGSMDPLFWIFLAILVAERIINSGGSFMDALVDKLLILPGIIIAPTAIDAVDRNKRLLTKKYFPLAIKLSAIMSSSAGSVGRSMYNLVSQG